VALETLAPAIASGEDAFMTGEDAFKTLTDAFETLEDAFGPLIARVWIIPIASYALEIPITLLRIRSWQCSQLSLSLIAYKDLLDNGINGHSVGHKATIIRYPLSLTFVAMLKSKDLSYHYAGKGPIGFPDLSIEDSQHLLITGGSGSGKTTLLHLLAGSLEVQNGELSIMGTSMKGMDGAKRDAFRAKNIGIVLQRSHFISSLSVEQNLVTASYAAGMKTNKKRIQKVCADLGIESKLKEAPNDLSQGEQQRVSIARAVLNEPKIILADEPTSSLDDENCDRVIKLLLDQAAATGASLIVVTHDQRVKDQFDNHIAL